MPEIDKCRTCAHCCEVCIFLEYDKKIKLFGCLIYNNKNRVPIRSERLEFIRDSTYDTTYNLFLVFDSITKMVEGNGYPTCHNYQCTPIRSKKRIANNNYSRTLSNIKKSKKLRKTIIPNFNDLVEILNG